MKKITLTEEVDRALYQIFDAALEARKMQIMDVILMVRSKIEDELIAFETEKVEKIIPIVETQ